MGERSYESGHYNLADALLKPNLTPGRAEKTAYIDHRRHCSYAELDAQSNRTANLLLELGLQREDRILVCLHDQIEWPATFLGAVKAGIVPVAVNTMLTPADYDFLLRDSRAKALIVAADVYPKFAPILEGQPYIRHVVTLGTVEGLPELDALTATTRSEFETVDTCRDEPAFWQYSSGTTGLPKGVVHVHGSLMACVEHYALGVLGLLPDDLIFSAARMFFGYGMGNSIAFPLAIGATAVLHPGRPTPEAIENILRRHRPTVFFGVPTLYASMLASDTLPGRDELALRLCVSAGESLPPQIGRRWRERTGLDIVEGLGSTEMLHIFLSQRPGEVKYGTTGKPVPGFEVKLIGDDGKPVALGDIGEIHVKGPSSAACYWNQRAKSQATFLGEWTRSADKAVLGDDGFITVTGRSDDMLKVGGIYVSPLEVETAILEHWAVAEVAVVADTDDDGLIKPLAFVVLQSDAVASIDMADEIKAHVRQLLAPFKYPRWIRFVPDLPKTSTGKIQRFALRS